MIFGCNTQTLSDYNSAIPNVTGTRSYSTADLNATPNGAESPGQNGLPQNWPTFGNDPNGHTIVACLSIQPDLNTLLSGAFDSTFQTWQNQAPQHSMVGLWHEASGQVPKGSYPQFSSGLLKSAQLHVQSVMAGSNIHVGAIEVTSGCSGWMAKDLDFYATDTYDDKNGNADASAQVTNFAALCNATNPKIAVRACNSHID